MRPWGNKESLRRVFLLDKTLHLEERAITAWEILRRGEQRAAERLVLKEAGDRLKGISAKTLFKRRLTWHAFSVPPLLMLWFLLLWFDIGVHFDKVTRQGLKPSSMAQKLKAFAQEVEEQARSEQLTESLKIAKALEEVADETLQREIAEEKLKKSLAATINEIGEQNPLAENEADQLLPILSGEGLLRLKAELEMMEHALTLPDASTQRNERLGAKMLGMLGAFSRLRAELEKAGLTPIEGLRRKEFRKFLDRLGKDVQKGLDRNTLREITEFLTLLLEGADGRESAEAIMGTGQVVESGRLREDQSGAKGSFPGDQPGTQGQVSKVPPSFEARAVDHLKGLLREGKSSGVMFRGTVAGGKSKISEEAVVTSYQHQAEEELASERIPQRLKETIRSYFLSLGMTGKQKGE